MKTSMMMIATTVLLSTSAVIGSKTVLAATTDDVKWINQCVTDNKDEGAAAPVVLKYCTCMNNKMSNNETRSITQWEKTHATERHACERQAGWK